MGRRRGVIGTLVKISKDIEKAERRNQRARQAQLRAAQRAAVAHQKLAELQQASEEVELYEKTVALLTTVHRECSDRIDWDQIERREQPRRPPPDTTEIDAAKAALDVYRPNLVERLLGLTGRLRALERVLETAQQDAREREKSEETRHQTKVLEWRESVDTARAVLRGDLETYVHVVDESGCLEELDELGCAIRITFPRPDLARVEMRVPGEEVVPTEVKSLTAKGKLSAKKMAKAQFFEIYQDFICGAALRVGRELTAVLPLKGVLVDVACPASLLDAGTGHPIEGCILSVMLESAELDRINFAGADASNAIERQKHAMRFSRGKGMAPVDSLADVYFA